MDFKTVIIGVLGLFSSAANCEVCFTCSDARDVSAEDGSLLVRRSKRNIHVDGLLCETRQGGCCLGRDDDCFVMNSHSRCFCDMYCARTLGKEYSDCCTDFASFCFGPGRPITPDNVNDACVNHKCENGMCINLIDDYLCYCNHGYAGTYCDTVVGGCSCFNGGTCVHGGALGYTCSCPSVYMGYHCETSICEDVAKNPCKHGTCSLQGYDFHCTCELGFTGATCDVNIDDCVNHQCKKGSCYDQTNGYLCFCYPGYTGRYCNIDIDECATNPCEHNGTCTDFVNGYSCTCVPGYTGIECETDIDECASDPCQNGATCKDWVNAFSCTCAPRYYGDLCDTGICQPTIADVMFVLDSSVSQTEAEFRKQLEFVTHFIDNIVVGVEHFQIAVITYSYEAKVEIRLTDHYDNSTLKEAVRNITFRPGATFTHKGLEAVTSVLEHSPRPNNKTARRYVFLLTDGMSTYRQQTKSAADALKPEVTKVIAVGIGKQVSHRELLDVASPGDAASPVYVFSVENFNSLYSVVKQLVHITCDECLNSSSSDIVFLLDSGPSMSDKDFEAGIEAVSYLIQTMIRSETDIHTMRIGLITYDTVVTTRRTFADGMTKPKWLPYLQRLIKPEMTCHQPDACAAPAILGKALDEVSQSFKNVIVAKDSDESRQFLILLTNGENKIAEDVENRLVSLRKDGVYVFVIGCGPDSEMSSLLSLVTDPNNVFLVEKGVNATHLDVLMAQFIYDSCALTNDF